MCALAKPLALFGLVCAGILLAGMIQGHEPTPRHLLLSATVAAVVTLLWDFFAHRPIRTGLRHLEKRMRRLSARHQDAPAGNMPVGTGETLQLNRMLASRQRHIAAYTRRLRREIDRLNAIYRQSHDAVMLFDPKTGSLIDCNPSAIEMLGGRAETLEGLPITDLLDEDAGTIRSVIDDVMDKPQGRSLRLSYRAGDGRIIPAEVSMSAIEEGNRRLLLCSARDVSERENAAQKIEHLAYHDTLTNLPNRTLLTDRVNRALARARRTGQKGALLFLDLDKFKRINDSLGHSVGDALLKELANRLRGSLREEDTVARLGGDEFVVLLEGLGQHQENAARKANEITAKLQQCFKDEFHLDGHELYVTTSIGIVTFPKDGDTVDTLLRHADTAMYHAKGAGRDGARVFEQRMDETAMSRLQYENELRSGLHNGEFRLFFQPVLNIRDGSVLGAETLLRWQHPRSGLISPSDFLPYIENSALMLQLDEWVLAHTCELLGRIQQDEVLGDPDCLSLNVSYQQFHQPDFVDRVTRVLEESGADPGRLQFEVTETILLKDNRESVTHMNVLKQLGIRFAIDDFGTGYSSLADLRQLPIDTLKIDRTLVRDIATDPNDAAIVRAILSMVEHIGLNAVAEGVETREQLHFLRESGCTHYQGYLGRPPLTESVFLEDLAVAANETPLALPKARFAERTGGSAGAHS